jgi:hypothetical protein
LGYISGDSFTNSSGHPCHSQHEYVGNIGLATPQRTFGFSGEKKTFRRLKIKAIMQKLVFRVNKKLKLIKIKLK